MKRLMFSYALTKTSITATRLQFYFEKIEFYNATFYYQFTS